MSRFLPDLENTFGVDISNFSDSELLNFYDNPDNFYIKESHGEKKDTIDFPDNIILTLPHGVYTLPSKEESSFPEGKLRLLKNFSDFGTTHIVNFMNIPKEQIVRAKYSRAIGDLNRELHDDSENGFLRKKDFDGNLLFDDIQKFRNEGENQHKTFHNKIEEKLQKVEIEGKKSFLFDIHDTGVRKMGLEIKDDTIKEELFPLITIADIGGTSCEDGMLEYFGKCIEEELGIKPVLRDPYRGGYISNKHGTEQRSSGNKKRNVIQIEVCRCLYMRESTQEVDKKKTRIIGEGLKRAITETVKEIS